jgi:hypothetical protein
MELPLESATSVIGNTTGGLSTHLLRADGRQETERKRHLRSAIWRYKVTQAAERSQLEVSFSTYHIHDCFAHRTLRRKVQ